MDASQIRLKARESLKGNYWPAVGVAFVAAIFGALMTTGGSFSINIEKDGYGKISSLLVSKLTTAGAAEQSKCRSLIVFNE